MLSYAPTGLPGMGDVPWGSHVCQFFSNNTDLRDTIVPYFKAGLENNERCLLVAMEPFSPDDARSALRAVVSDFDRREQRKQIEIHDVRAWYDNDTVIKGDEIVAGLIANEERARIDGYNGFRTHGNIGWLGRNQWEDFQDYEAGVTRGLKGRRMISMCSYCLDNCSSQDVLDVMTRHNLAITKRRDRWSCVAITPAKGSSRTTLTSIAPLPELPLQNMLELVPAAIYTTDRDGYLTFFNEKAIELWGYRPEIRQVRWDGASRIVLLDGAVVPQDQSPMASALATGQPVSGVEAYVERADGSRTACVHFAAPMFDAERNVIGGINMLVDITPQRTVQERQSILVRELDHRIKNNLATIQAIAASTIRNARSMDEFQQAFTGRIAALSNTHSLLTDHELKHVPLRQLLINELGIYDDGEGQRIVLDGPDVVLPAHVAVSYGMTIHELTTNALKYGALSVLGGVLRVSWTLQDTLLVLRWEELNVAITGQPTRVGFGTQLLRRLLPHQLGAQVDMKFEPDGLKAEISVQLA